MLIMIMMMMMTMIMMTMMMMTMLTVTTRLAFHNKAAILEHLHSLLLTASLLFLGLAILQVSTLAIKQSWLFHSQLLATLHLIFDLVIQIYLKT